MLAVIQEAYIEGISARQIDDRVQALGLRGVYSSPVSQICQGLDEMVEPFRQRPLLGKYPYLWLDALSLKAHEKQWIVSKAMFKLRVYRG